jgi:hypothetical protein
MKHMPTASANKVAMLAFTLFALCQNAIAASSKLPQIWFSLQSGADAVADYMELFRLVSPWASAASHVSGLRVSESFVMHGSIASQR